MRDILKRSVSMKAFIAAIVIMAALAFGGAYAATQVFLTPVKMEELRGIRYQITGDVGITAIDIVFDDSTPLTPWHVLVTGEVKITAANGTYTLTPTITVPGGVNKVETSVSISHTTSGTAATPFTNKDLGTLDNYPTGNYLILVKATKTA